MLAATLAQCRRGVFTASHPASVSMRDARASLVRTILVAGLIAGATDLTAAFVTGGARGIPPMVILQFIASGVLGPAAFAQSGAGIAALGVLLHFLIMQGIAAGYVAAGRQYGFLLARPLRYGPLYGIVVYAVMNLIVVPLSAVPASPGVRTPGSIATGLIVHALCVGLPIALVAAHGARRG